MFCPRPALLNPGATPAVLSQPRRKHPSAERFVQRPASAVHELSILPAFTPKPVEVVGSHSANAGPVGVQGSLAERVVQGGTVRSRE